MTIKEEEPLDYDNSNWMMPPNENRAGAVHIRKSTEGSNQAIQHISYGNKEFIDL